MVAHELICHYCYIRAFVDGQGWDMALQRLRDEVKAAGANAVLDVKMRTVPISGESSMDFTLIGTAVRVEGLPPSADPISSLTRSSGRRRWPTSCRRRNR